MKQIPVAFDKNTEEKLRKNSKKKDMKLAQYIRSLVDVGLRVEEISEQNASSEGKSNLTNELEFHKKLFHKDLLSGYETLYLTRYILSLLPEEKPGEHNKTLDTAKLKAQSFVEGLIG